MVAHDASICVFNVQKGARIQRSIIYVVDGTRLVFFYRYVLFGFSVISDAASCATSARKALSAFSLYMTAKLEFSASSVVL